MSDDEVPMVYDAPVIRDELGQFMTVLNEEYPVANHKTQRRNPTSYEGTSSDAVRVRNAIDISKWTEGSWKFARVLADSMKAEEQEVMGIEEELTADPNLIVIDAAEMHPMAIEDILAITEHHKAQYVHMTTNKGSNKTRGNGYRRLKQVAQNFQKLSPKVITVTIIQKAKNILKAGRQKGDISEEVEEKLYGNFLNAIIEQILSINGEMRTMEKTAGSKFLKEYVENQPDGLEVFKILEEKRISDIVHGVRAGDSKIAFDISSPIYIDGGDE